MVGRGFYAPDDLFVPVESSHLHIGFVKRILALALKEDSGFGIERGFPPLVEYVIQYL